MMNRASTNRETSAHNPSDLTLTDSRFGIEFNEALCATERPLAVSPELAITPGPSAEELAVLRRLEAAGAASGSSSAP